MPLNPTVCDVSTDSCDRKSWFQTGTFLHKETKLGKYWMEKHWRWNFFMAQIIAFLII